MNNLQEALLAFQLQRQQFHNINAISNYANSLSQALERQNAIEKMYKSINSVVNPSWLESINAIQKQLNGIPSFNPLINPIPDYSYINNMLAEIHSPLQAITELHNSYNFGFSFEGAFANKYLSLYREIPDYAKIVLLPDDEFEDELFVQYPDIPLYALSQQKDISGSRTLFKDIDEKDLIKFIYDLSKTDLGTELPIGKKIKEDLIIYKKNYLSVIKENTILFRSRELKNPEEMNYLPQQILDISFGTTGQNRFNRPGVECLYLAETQKTAETEIRISDNQKITTVQANLTKEIPILDISEKENIIFEYCQKPNYEKSTTFPRAYIFPNFIANVCRLIGIEGIKYKSTITDEICYVFFYLHSDSFRNVNIV